MSGLYNMVFETNPNLPGVIGAIISGGECEFGRLRDAWIENSDDGELIARVITRNGGANRPDQASAIAMMQAHPWYSHDEDEGYDSTYASFYFRLDMNAIEKQVLEEGGSLASISVINSMRESAVDHVDFQKKWDDALELIQGKGKAAW